MSDDQIQKLAKKAQDDFNRWAKVTLKHRREELGQALNVYEAIKRRVNDGYIQMEKHLREVNQAKKNMEYHADMIAKIEMEIATLEQIYGKVEITECTRSMAPNFIKGDGNE